MTTLVFAKKSLVRFLSVWVLIGLVGILVVSYVIFIQKAIVKTAERTLLERKVTELNIQVSTLEAKYINLGQKIGSGSISLFGLLEVDDPIFVQRTLMSDRFSFNVNEI